MKYLKPNRVPREKTDTIEIRWAKGKDDYREDLWARWGNGASKDTSILCLNAIATLTGV